MKKYLSVFIALCVFQFTSAQETKKQAPKPEAKKTETAANLVVALADAFSGATSQDFAANGKILRGVLNAGDKFQLITADNQVVDCTIREIQVVSNNLKVKQAGKDAELFLTFSVSKPDVECSNGCIAATGTIKSYSEFQKVQQEYKPTPVTKAGNGGNDNVYQLKSK